jgi:hypothetical protein
VTKALLSGIDGILVGVGVVSIIDLLISINDRRR